MSTASDIGAEMASTLDAVSKAIKDTTKAVMRDSSKAARKHILKQAGVVPGGDRRFSNMARYSHGGRLNLTTKSRDLDTWVLPRGPWKLAETGAAAHRFGRGMHPGTRQGRRSWTVGQEATFEELERTVPKEITDAVEGAFRRG